MRYLLIALLLLALPVQASAVTLRSDYPKQYVVQPGDTLWSIACRYLEKPWEWKELWYANPQVKNPNRLHVGAVLRLSFSQNRPYIRVLSNGTVKLSPNIRRTAASETITTIRLTDIKPFFNESIVMDRDSLLSAPYVVSLPEERMLGGQGDEIYVKKLHPSPLMPRGATIPYAIYRPNCPYVEPKINRVIGYKATLVGYGELVKGGEPARVIITNITEGVRLKDRVLLNDFPDFKPYFIPKAPMTPIRGKIIDILGDYTQGAVGLVAVLNRGENVGLEPGDVLGIYSPAKLVPDPLIRGKSVRIPPERVGEVMVFRVFSETSFALVMRSVRAIHLKDCITNP
ncbi:LysM peptidoglycan-binding domain-containing protein [Legionella dresdenensis]|uniref:LysM peptidoglycan-binding domain-containing protein n=1 Tax=Legionella dresdenensis TaxID=450200 RepID=A0ABV8CFL5_9GAMM